MIGKPYMTQGASVVVELRERVTRLETKLEVLPQMAEDVSEIKELLAERRGADTEKEKAEAFHRKKTLVMSWGGSSGIFGLFELLKHWL